jgi:hypothetical protein
MNVRAEGWPFLTISPHDQTVETGPNSDLVYGVLAWNLHPSKLRCSLVA